MAVHFCALGTETRVGVMVWPIEVTHSAMPSPQGIPVMPTHLLRGHLCLQAAPSAPAKKLHTGIGVYPVGSASVWCDCDT